MPGNTPLLGRRTASRTAPGSVQPLHTPTSPPSRRLTLPIPPCAGVFVTGLQFGTPPQTVQLLIDTGSGITHLAGKGCGSSCGLGLPPTAGFDPAASSSAARVACDERCSCPQCECQTQGVAEPYCVFRIAYGAPLGGRWKGCSLVPNCYAVAAWPFVPQRCLLDCCQRGSGCCIARNPPALLPPLCALAVQPWETAAAGPSGATRCGGRAVPPAPRCVPGQPAPHWAAVLVAPTSRACPAPSTCDASGGHGRRRVSQHQPHIWH